MPYKQFDRTQLKVKPLSERVNKVHIEQDYIRFDQKIANTSVDFLRVVQDTAERIRAAHQKKAPVMLTFGAHSIKNGLGPLMIKMMEEGWLTHLSTNGAGIIHDWEFAFQGESSEDVKGYVDQGQFGIWEETGRNINLALVAGAFEGKGYGESVGSMIENEGVEIPSEKAIAGLVHGFQNNDLEKTAAALDFLDVIRRFDLNPGWLKIPFPYKSYCVQGAAFRLGIPFTGHPMIGHDIIYTHPMNKGAAVGRTALRDFLSFADSVNNLDNGVYMSIGSAVMSPMIFEKSLSMSQNVHIQKKSHMDSHFMLIVDLAKSNWDWQKNGEPPQTDPAYYLRYLKSFSRMGGIMQYLSADNRDFLLALYQDLNR